MSRVTVGLGHAVAFLVVRCLVGRELAGVLLFEQWCATRAGLETRRRARGKFLGHIALTNPKQNGVTL
jgi:hypothetical protein